MLKGNLSTRPFYNESLVSLLLAVVAVAGAALAAYNVTELTALSSQRGALGAVADHDRAEAKRIDARRTQLERNIDVARLRFLSASTHEANAFIDQRTFSWTGFFGHVEKTLPLDAYLVGVAPRLEKGEIRISMMVVSKSTDEIEDFVNDLEKTGAFYDVLPQQWRQNDDGTLTTRIEASYLSPMAEAPGRKTDAPRTGARRRP
jgi:hypothetical protein